MRTTPNFCQTAGTQRSRNSLARVFSTWLLAFALAVLLPLASPQVKAETLTNQDVVKLVEAGLSSETINLSIRAAAATKFDTSAGGLAALAKAGVPDSVVQAMIKRKSGGGTSAPAQSAAQPAVTLRPLKSVRRSVQPKAITPEVGQQYFTRYNIWHERGKHSTTGYTRGTLLPINSKVTLESLGAKKMVLVLESGESVTVALAQKTTLRPLDDVAVELLSERQVPISKLGKDISRAISQGTLRLGMTREQVIMTRGYPPRHKTPSIEDDQWIFWSSRFVQLTLIFQDGVLARGRGLR